DRPSARRSLDRGARYISLFQSHWLDKQPPTLLSKRGKWIFTPICLRFPDRKPQATNQRKVRNTVAHPLERQKTFLLQCQHRSSGNYAFLQNFGIRRRTHAADQYERRQ